MEPVHLEVAGFLRRAGVGRDERLLVAASGGSDSTALLYVLAALGQPLAVAHVHHGLRGEEADRDLRFVEVQADALGVPSHTRRVDASRTDGRSPEARARALRYAALEELRARADCRFVVTAHTLEDQAETVLLRAIRGTGPGGLAGIEPVSAARHLLRPLLGVRRDTLRAYLRRRGIAWCEDTSNLDPRLTRNRLRREVLPVLESAHPGAARKLAELAEAARETEAWLTDSLESVLAGALEPGDGGTWIDPHPLLGLAPALRARAVLWLMRRAGLDQRVSRRHVERVLRFLATGGTGRRLSLPAGRVLWADRERLWLGPIGGPRFPEPFRASLAPPQPLPLVERGVRFVWGRGGAPSGTHDWLRVATDTPLIVRSPVSEDHMRLGRGDAPRALKELFTAARWSRRERARALVVEQDDEIVWVVGLAHGPGHGVAARGEWVVGVERLSGVSESC
jgi:tRNA(Ile)-lysidine synthase